MKAQIEAIVSELAATRKDRRLHIFSVQVESADASAAKLRGRVLEKSDLEALKTAISKKFASARVDTSAVQVLRQSPPVMRAVATNLTDLHLEPSFLSELMTQVYNGAVAEILETKDKWTLMRQPDGYFGWAYTGFFSEDTPPARTHIVTTPIASIYAEPSIAPSPISVLLGGTSVCISETRGTWSRIKPAGSMLHAGWIAAADLRSTASFPLAPQEARKQIVLDASRWTGTYYLWGGCSAWGIDCSGLAQLSHRLCGYILPRDADMQFEAGQPVEAPYQAGDLFFFHKETDKTKAGHVGLCTGGTNMIHSSRTSNGVYQEDFQKRDGLRTSFMGARTFIPR